jgi:hypothetical protein
MHPTPTPKPPPANGTPPALRLATPAAADPALPSASAPALVVLSAASVEALVRRSVAEATAAAGAELAALQDRLTGQLREVTELLDQLRAAASVQADTATSTAPAAGYLSRTQFAERMGLSVATFDRLESAAKIGPRATRPNGARGRKLYDRAEVEAWLASPRGNDGQLPDRRAWEALRVSQSKRGHRS